MQRVLTREMRFLKTDVSGLVNLCSFVKEHLNDIKLKIIEIGVYSGSGSKILADSFPESIIHCVDPWDRYTDKVDISIGQGDSDKQYLELQEAEQIFNELIKHYKNIIKNKTYSAEFSKQIDDNSVDFIYIDGNHELSSVKQDLEVWYPKIKNNGIIAGHDWVLQSVRSALNEFFKTQPFKTFEDDSWLYIKL